MADKIITIDGIEVALHSSGATNILYKSEFQRDLFKDFAKVQEIAIDAVRAEENGEEYDAEDSEASEMLTRAAYIMARQAYAAAHATGGSFPSFLEWCDQFSLIGLARDIYQVAPVIVADRQTQEEAKKKN